MEEIKVKLSAIDYDTDGEAIEGLPTEMVTTLSEMGYDPENGYNEDDVYEWLRENAADYVTEQTGWLVNSLYSELMDELP
jgi:hypothetical protein